MLCTSTAHIDWSSFLANTGIIAGLFASARSIWRETKVRRAETLLEVTKQHREIWNYYEEHPELHGLFVQTRNMEQTPLTRGELRFANNLFLHLCASYGARRAGIHRMPVHVADDWREIFSHPAVTEVWLKMRHLHDPNFVRLVESYRTGKHLDWWNVWLR